MINNLATKLKIIKCLIDEDNPLILNHIAKKTDLDIQLVKYHIKNLIADGIVNTAIEAEKKYYYLCDPFYDENNMNALYALLTPYIEATAKEMTEDNPEITEREILNTFMYLLLLFIDNVNVEIVGEKHFH